jgi:hypothetical protein
VDCGGSGVDTGQDRDNGDGVTSDASKMGRWGLPYLFGPWKFLLTRNRALLFSRVSYQVMFGRMENQLGLVGLGFLQEKILRCRLGAKKKNDFIISNEILFLWNSYAVGCSI